MNTLQNLVSQPAAARFVPAPMSERSGTDEVHAALRGKYLFETVSS